MDLHEYLNTGFGSNHGHINNIIKTDCYQTSIYNNIKNLMLKPLVQMHQIDLYTFHIFHTEDSLLRSRFEP